MLLARFRLLDLGFRGVRGLRGFRDFGGFRVLRVLGGLGDRSDVFFCALFALSSLGISFSCLLLQSFSG